MENLETCKKCGKQGEQGFFISVDKEILCGQCARTYINHFYGVLEKMMNEKNGIQAIKMICANCFYWRASVTEQGKRFSLGFCFLKPPVVIGDASGGVLSWRPECEADGFCSHIRVIRKEENAGD